MTEDDFIIDFANKFDVIVNAARKCVSPKNESQINFKEALFKAGEFAGVTIEYNYQGDGEQYWFLGAGDHYGGIMIEFSADSPDPDDHGWCIWLSEGFSSEGYTFYLEWVSRGREVFLTEATYYMLERDTCNVLFPL